MTSALHAEGPQFDPGRVYFWDRIPGRRDRIPAVGIESLKSAKRVLQWPSGYGARLLSGRSWVRVPPGVVVLPTQAWSYGVIG